MGHSKNIGNCRKLQKAVETIFNIKIKNVYKTTNYDWT